MFHSFSSQVVSSTSTDTQGHLRWWSRHGSDQHPAAFAGDKATPLAQTVTASGIADEETSLRKRSLILDQRVGVGRRDGAVEGAPPPLQFTAILRQELVPKGP